MRRSAWLIPFSLTLAPLSAASAADLWVSPAGDYATISKAVAAASPGDRILVETGTYFENVTLVDGIELLGGFAPGDPATRDPAAYPTVIDGTGAAPAVSSGPGVGPTTRVDGFGLTGGGGHACIVVAGGAPVFSGNEIYENRSGGFAGGAYVYGNSTARFENNVFRRNLSGGSGGGLRVEKSPIEISGNTFDDNDATHAGGGLYVFQAAVACSSNIFRDCEAGDSGGGGAYFQNVPAGGTLVGNDFQSCSATRGGGVMIRDESFLTLEDNDFQECSALRAVGVAGSGGGVAVFNHSDVTLSDNRFSDCSAEVQGGGFYAWRSVFRIQGTDGAERMNPRASFSSCTADSGGAFYASECTGSTFSNQRVSDCTATGWGGGLFVFTSQVTISECLIERCVAVDGGGVTFYTERTNAPRSLFLNNTVYACAATAPAGDNPGGGILHAALGFQADIATISGNLITHTTMGSCIRCRGVAGQQASRPTIQCSSFHKQSSNTSTVIGNPQCQGAFNSGIGNLAIDATGNNFYRGPQYCDESMLDFRLRECANNQDRGSLCQTALPGRMNRGVTDGTCACTLVALEPTSWGQVKAKYR
jgi:hypothetical protein